MLMPVWAVLAALLAGSLLILLAGSNPLDAYAALFGGAFLDYYGLGATLVKVSPLLLAGLAVAVPMRAGLFNIGGEGQIYIGALFATAAALYLPATTPVLDISICALAGMVGGGLWAFIAAYLKAYRGINEVITTILLNYIGIYVVSYFVNGPMKEPGAVYPSSPEISMDLWLPIVMPRTDAHLGGAIGLAAALMLYVIYRYTTFGFAAETVSLAGLAGGFEVLGLKYRLFSMFSDGYGYDGIVVALLVSANILLVPLAALFMAGLAAGASIMSRAVGVDATVVGAIQGLVVIFVAASVAARFNRAFWTRFLTGKTANRSRPDEAGAR
jgi:simple sugar transport system permease protein